MWDLIVSVPDHCFSFYFSNIYYMYNKFFKSLTPKVGYARKGIQTGCSVRI